MSIRDQVIRRRLAIAMHDGVGGSAHDFGYWLGKASDVLAACPEIAALDHAREGWLSPRGHIEFDRESAGFRDDDGVWHLADWPRVLVIDAPESS